MTQQVVFANQNNTPDLNPNPFREIDHATEAAAVEEIRRLGEEEFQLQKRRAELYQNRNAIKAALENRSPDGVIEAVRRSKETADAFAPLRVIKKDMLQAATTAVNSAAQIPGAVAKLDEAKKQFQDEISQIDPFARKVRLLREDSLAFAANHRSTETRFNAALGVIRAEHLAEFEAARKRFDDFTMSADQLEQEFSEKYSETSQRIAEALKGIKTPAKK